MAKAPSLRTIQCYHCRHRFEVASKAMSIPCPKCAKALVVEDVVIKTAHNVRKIQTCGKLIVEKKGRVVAQSVEAQGGVEVEGYLEAKVQAGGHVKIGAKAQWKGDCAAPSLEVELGGRIERGYFVIPEDPLGVGDMG
jgi:cytoskeletal protein CcmA (bactofilin family)